MFIGKKEQTKIKSGCVQRHLGAAKQSELKLKAAIYNKGL